MAEERKVSVGVGRARTLTLPRMFVDDHMARECPTPAFVRESARYVWVRSDDADLPELLSDAEHYSDFDSWSDDGEENAANRPLAGAARRLVAAIRKGLEPQG